MVPTAQSNKRFWGAPVRLIGLRMRGGRLPKSTYSPPNHPPPHRKKPGAEWSAVRVDTRWGGAQLGRRPAETEPADADRGVCRARPFPPPPAALAPPRLPREPVRALRAPQATLSLAAGFLLARAPGAVPSQCLSAPGRGRALSYEDKGGGEGPSPHPKPPQGPGAMLWGPVSGVPHYPGWPVWLVLHLGGA